MTLQNIDYLVVKTHHYAYLALPSKRDAPIRRDGKESGIEYLILSIPKVENADQDRNGSYSRNITSRFSYTPEYEIEKAISEMKKNVKTYVNDRFNKSNRQEKFGDLMKFYDQNWAQRRKKEQLTDQFMTYADARGAKRIEKVILSSNGIIQEASEQTNYARLEDIFDDMHYFEKGAYTPAKEELKTSRLHSLYDNFT